MKTRTEIGSHNGIKYRLKYDRFCNEFGWGERAYFWFLFIENEYQGCYKTKREALADINP